jgi:hypothetical protein
MGELKTALSLDDVLDGIDALDAIERGEAEARARNRQRGAR